MQMLIEGDFGRLVALILGFYLCRLRHLSPSLLLQVEPSVFSKYCQAPTELKRCARRGHWTNWLPPHPTERWTAWGLRRHMSCRCPLDEPGPTRQTRY